MKYNPGWDFTYTMDEQVKCVLCLKSDMPMLVRGSENTGVCEPCAAIAHHLWRQEQGEIPPGYPETAKTEVARVYVLIPRLSTSTVELAPDGKEVHTKPDRLLPNSYEFVMLPNEVGTLDLPGVNVGEKESLREAAERALRLVKILTWPHPGFVEPLYTAYTPRGRLASVSLVTAWRLVNADALQDGLEWRKWPISNKETPMAGFYKSLETVWAMRLYQHNRGPSRTEAISVRVRGAGSQYIELQQALRAETANLDMSMVEIMRRSMTDDEKMIDKLIGEHEVLSRELREQQKADALAAGEDGSEEIRAKMSRGEQVLVKGDAGAGAVAVSNAGENEESGDESGEASDDSAGDGTGTSASLLDAADDGDGDGDGGNGELEEEEEQVVPEGPPPEGFVRRGRDLSMKRELK